MDSCTIARDDHPDAINLCKGCLGLDCRVEMSGDGKKKKLARWQIETIERMWNVNVKPE